MHIIGSVIKQAVELRQKFKGGEINAAEIQKEELIKLLEKAKDTAFGKYYSFGKILENPDPAAEFARQVPVFDYDSLYEKWWHRTLETPDITWPGQPDYFAKSSGTTGDEPKRIPVTEAMVDSIRSVGLDQLTSISNYDLPTEFFETQLLALGSSTDLEEVDGHEEGEISGITASNVPNWFSTVYKPGPDIAAIPDWDERVAKIAEEAPNWDIGAVSGIPSWILLMMKKVMEVNGAKTIHEVWPNFKVYTPGGVAFAPFKSSFEEIFSKEVLFLDTYLASEGFFAYNARPQTDAMKLALEHGIYYEFIPFDERGFDDTGNLLENPEVHTISEVDTETNYAMIVSTCSGAWRYMIGDTIQFDNLEHYEIRITGRTKYFLNVVGSQLGEDKMNDAIQKAKEKHGLKIEEFTVAAVKDDSGDYWHEWVIGAENPDNEDCKAVAETLDETLKNINKNYGVARTKALSGVRVHLVDVQKFHDWHARNRKKGGQIKTKKLMKEEDFLEFKGFCTAE